MALDPKVRTAALIVGASLSSSIATAMVMASMKIDLYALVDHLGEVVKDATALVAAGTALATVVAGILKSTDKAMAIDIKERAKDPESALKGVVTKNNDAGHELAESIPGPVVAAGTDQAERLAKPQEYPSS